MKTIETQIQINATLSEVWDILTDFDSYLEWNPFIKRITGEAIEGKKLAVTISPPNQKSITFFPTVLSSQKGSRFSWLGHLLFPGIFDGEHIFIIEENEKGSLFIQKENFKGLLVPLVWKSMEKDTKAGFELMNRALKQRVEEING